MTNSLLTDRGFVTNNYIFNGDGNDYGSQSGIDMLNFEPEFTKYLV